MAAFSGDFISALQPLGILVPVLLIADLPISLLYAVLAMSGKHDALALSCLVLGGTAWWYGLCRMAEKIATIVRARWEMSVSEIAMFRQLTFQPSGWQIRNKMSNQVSGLARLSLQNKVRRRYRRENRVWL
jgi:hypothetical protein